MIWIVAALLKKTDVYEILLVGTPRTRTLDNVPNMSVSKTDHADTVRRQSHARTHGGRGRWTMSQYVHVRHIWRGHRKCTTLAKTVEVDWHTTKCILHPNRKIKSSFSSSKTS